MWIARGANWCEHVFVSSVVCVLLPRFELAVAVGSRAALLQEPAALAPEPGETVWWRERGRFDMGFRGHHGGLAEDEARTQVAALLA